MARLTTMITPSDLRSNDQYPSMEIGTKAETADGRRFRYAKAGGSGIVVGKLYQGAAQTTGWQDLDVVAAAKGDTVITTSSTMTATLNQLAGGFMVVTNDSTYPGYTYKIKSNTAASGAVCVITLEEPLAQSIVGSTSSDVDLVKHPYDYVELWDASNHDCTPVGVGVFPITASYYGWLQVGGPCGVLVDSDNMTVGMIMVGSDDVDGCVGPCETDALWGVVGTAMTTGSSTEYGFVNLNIN
jgi:hypothetical protein